MKEVPQLRSYFFPSFGQQSEAFKFLKSGVCLRNKTAEKTVRKLRR